MRNHTSPTTEEIITALWTICAILCFAHGFTVAGWAFTIKALMDLACVFILIYREWKTEG